MNLDFDDGQAVLLPDGNKIEYSRWRKISVQMTRDQMIDEAVRRVWTYWREFPSSVLILIKNEISAETFVWLVRNQFRYIAQEQAG